jgi:hypothetical protein
MTEAIRKAVAEVLPQMRTMRGACDEDFYFGRADFLTLIAALEDMQGVADGTHVVVPVEPTDGMRHAGFRAMITDNPQLLDIYRAMISKAQEK